MKTNQTQAAQFVIAFRTETQAGFKPDGTPNRGYWGANYHRGFEQDKGLKDPCGLIENAKTYKTRKGAEKTAQFIRDTFGWEPSEITVEEA